MNKRKLYKNDVIGEELWSDETAGLNVYSKRMLGFTTLTNISTELKASADGIFKAFC